MASSLLEQATENTALMVEIADAVKAADPSVNLEDVATLLASLESSLSSLAGEKDLTFEKEAARVVSAAELEDAVATYVSYAEQHGDETIQIPAGTPLVLVFIAAALIFMPSILGVSSTT